MPNTPATVDFDRSNIGNESVKSGFSKGDNFFFQRSSKLASPNIEQQTEPNKVKRIKTKIIVENADQDTLKTKKSTQDEAKAKRSAPPRMRQKNIIKPTIDVQKAEVTK